MARCFCPAGVGFHFRDEDESDDGDGGVPCRRFREGCDARQEDVRLEETVQVEARHGGAQAVDRREVTTLGRLGSEVGRPRLR